MKKKKKTRKRQQTKKRHILLVVPLPFETLSPKYLAKIKAIREEFKCSFEKAEDIFVEKNIIRTNTGITHP